MSERVAIIGGGFSGLAAGVALAESGLKVVLLEGRNHLGGRAYSFADSKTGDVVDNGQHLFMGCYRHTISFLEKIGCLDRLKLQPRPRVDFLDGEDGFATFKCPLLPPPAHILAGLMGMKGISFGDKLRALAVGRAIKKSRSSDKNSDNLTVARWLDQLGQSDRIKERFWYPMAIATLNQNPEIASANMMRVVLSEAFGGSLKDSSLGISRVGLSRLYTEGAREFIESRGGSVRAGTHVRELVISDNRAVAAELRGGERVEADYFISSAPPQAFLKMLPDDLRRGEFAPLASLGSSPIVSINLWFDREITDCEFAGLLGTKVQWLFNKDLIFSTPGRSNQIALVISAARDYVDWTKQELVEMAMSELRELIPASRAATLLHSVVVKERDATLAHTVESDKLRPGPRTSVSNLILAGDWTNTGLPATIESAVLSGHVAARIICSEPSRSTPQVVLNMEKGLIGSGRP